VLQQAEGKNESPRKPGRVKREAEMNRGTKTKRKNEALKAPEKAFPEKKTAKSHSASNYSIIM
jgi:hypothetical protein